MKRSEVNGCKFQEVRGHRLWCGWLFPVAEAAVVLAMQGIHWDDSSASELWCQQKLLGAPRTARRSNQSVLKEINPEYSREGLMLKLKLQYFDYLMQRVNQGTDPDAGKD